MIHPPVPPELWAAEGARSAGSLDDVAAALVIGSEPAVAAHVALAIARAQPSDRRVAVADLVGGLPGLEPAAAPPAGAGAAEAPLPGLLDCVRDGLPVSAIARPLADDPRVFVLPAGGPDVGTRLVLESARWPRLVAGFREVDALLLLVVRADAPGLATLLSTMDGVVAVDLPPVVARAWPLLATVDRPEPELPPVAPIPERASPRRRWPLAVAGAALLATAGLAASWAFGAGARGRTTDGPASPDAGQPAGSAAIAPAASTPEPVPDTITIGAVVNPDDSLAAVGFTVELVAANTPAGANSLLDLPGVSLPVPTLVPVLLGADGRPWYRALTGAWRARAEAEAFLAPLRARGLVQEDGGRVLRAPYALLLAEGVLPEQASAAVTEWASRGIPAYALLQDDGSVRLFAGAFETPGQSVLVALSLRDLGAEPRLAFRTGRTF